MSERINYWQCSACHGTGEVLLGFYCDEILACDRCDGTGNAMVDGAKRRHERRLEEIRLKKSGRSTPAQSEREAGRG